MVQTLLICDKALSLEDYVSYLVVDGGDLNLLNIPWRLVTFIETPPQLKLSHHLTAFLFLMIQSNLQV